MRRLAEMWSRTSDRDRKRWAQFWSVVILLLLATTLTIAWSGRGQEPVFADPNYPGAVGQLISALGVVPLLAVGWILTNRATSNLYGWLWLLMPFVAGSQLLVQVLADSLLSNLRETGNLTVAVPGDGGYFIGAGPQFQVVRWLSLLGDYLWATSVVVLAFLLMMFPDGRLPSPGWRWVARTLGWAFVILVSVGWIGDGVSGTVPVRYPVSVFPSGSPASEVFRLLFDGVIVVSLLVGLAAGAVAVIVRFRRSAGVERQQIKWVAFAGLLFVPTIFWDAPGIWDPIIDTLVSASVPAAVALAVTRYRLYEIDRILSRTVAYGLVIGLLATVYFGGIFLMQELLPQQSDLAVAATTLAVAALFNPIRVRVLAAVDRRFNRARYNAEQVVNRFSDRLRDEVDIDLVTSDVGAVVGRVLQPNRLSLWIRD